ncbi:MAG: alpha/beta hydrolase [Solimonas sp.]
MASKPNVVLVHGFWGNASHWNKVILPLVRKGYDVSAVENPLTSLAEDAERTRKMIKSQPGPVVLVGHSYGGAVITEAGDLPNVAALVFVAAFAPDAGESLASIASKNPAPGGANLFPDEFGYLWIRKDKFRESFAQDVSDDDAILMAATQKAPLASVFEHQVTTAAWRRKPCWYQVSSEDRMIAPQTQQWLAERMKAATVTLNSSHLSPASQPDRIVAMIEQAAEAVGR